MRLVSDVLAGRQAPLAKRLVEMHGGQIEARNAEQGQGSEFVVRLPLADAARARHAESTAKPSTVSQQRILVVDDNLDAADSLAMLLKSYGADVAVAHDGTAALAALKAYRPSVILLDIGMPGMDGYELARRARHDLEGQAVTLIALTGWGQEKDRRLSKEAGIDYHFIKPVDWQVLAGLLTSLPPISQAAS